MAALLGGAGKVPEKIVQARKLAAEKPQEPIAVDENMIEHEMPAFLLDNQKPQEERNVRRQHTLMQEFTAIGAKLQGLQNERDSFEGGIGVHELVKTATGRDFEDFNSFQTLESAVQYLERELPEVRKELSTLNPATPSEQRLALQKKIGAIQILHLALRQVMEGV